MNCNEVSSDSIVLCIIAEEKSTQNRSLRFSFGMSLDEFRLGSEVYTDNYTGRIEV